jgi:hypothetical protein
MTTPSFMSQSEKVRKEVADEVEGKQTEAPSPRLKLTRFSELYSNRKPVSWLVKDVFPSKGLAYVFGPSGDCKTFVAVDIACHVTTGMDFREKATKPGSVAIAAGEGNTGLIQRVSAWIQAHESSYDPDIHITETGGNLDTAEGLTDVFEALDALPEPPSVVIVDTQSRWQVGDESSTRDGAAFVRALDAIRDKYDCLVIVVHHTLKSDPATIRGSGTFRGAADAMYLVRKTVTKGKTIVQMDCYKMKEAEEPPPLAWELVQLELDGFVTEDGEPVTSCWLSPTEVDSVSSGRPAKDIPVEIAVAIVKEYPGASQNELSEFLAERASEIMDKKVSKDTAKRLLQKLASLEPPRLIRIEDGKRISYRVTEADESQSPKKEDAA